MMPYGTSASHPLKHTGEGCHSALDWKHSMVATASKIFRFLEIKNFIVEDSLSC